MKLIELLDYVQLAVEDCDQFHRFCDALMVFEADIAFVKYAHDRYLPAAGAYRAFIKGGPMAGDKAAKLHAARRLGGYSRWLYARQEATFRRLARLWTHDVASPVSNMLIDRAWERFKLAERHWLSEARSKRQYGEGTV